MSEDVPQVDGVALALELTDLGLRMRLQRYRREHPDATPVSDR